MHISLLEVKWIFRSFAKSKISMIIHVGHCVMHERHTLKMGFKHMQNWICMTLSFRIWYKKIFWMKILSCLFDPSFLPQFFFFKFVFPDAYVWNLVSFFYELFQITCIKSGPFFIFRIFQNFPPLLWASIGCDQLGLFTITACLLGTKHHSAVSQSADCITSA